MSGSSWPMASSYAKMLQKPANAFLSDSLRQCEIKQDDKGFPRGAAGSFAVVYKATLPNGQHRAVRVFTSYRPEVNERYGAISTHLKKHSNLRSIVEFNYHEEGIRVPNKQGHLKKFPIVTMEWVQGKTLYEWAKHTCTAQDKNAIHEVGARWRELINELRSAQIAHGDLQHANVMVTPSGELKLVDYDCMCVPSLKGEKNIELGVVPYQPRDRNSETRLSLSLDNFSSIFIFVALRALSSDPGYWQEYVERTNYDKLLIRKEDLEDPQSSNLFSSLSRSGDADLSRMAKVLPDLYREDLDDIPPLEEFLFSYDRIASLLDARDFDKAVKLVNQNQSPGAEPPPGLVPRIADARKRVKCRETLETMATAGDEQGMARTYDAMLLDGYPAAKETAVIAKDAEKVVPIIAALEQLESQKKWRTFVCEWEAKKALLHGRKSCETFNQLGPLWKTRNQTCDTFLNIFHSVSKQAQPELTQLLQALKDVDKAGGHPEVDPHRGEVTRLDERDKAWTTFSTALQTALRTNALETDKQALATWSKPHFSSWSVAQQAQGDLQRIEQRVAAYRRIKQTVDAAPTPPTILGEKQIIDIAGAIDPNYKHDCNERITLASKRVTHLQTADHLFVENAHEKNLLKFYKQIVALKAESLLSGPQTERVKLAKARQSLIDKLAALPINLSLDKLDEQILGIWNGNLLNDCYDATQWQGAYEAAKERSELIIQMTTAIGRKDHPLVVKLAENALLSDYPLHPEIKRAIVRSVKINQNTTAILESLDEDDQQTFSAHFDASILRSLLINQKEKIAPHRDRVLEWSQALLNDLNTIGLTVPLVRPPVANARNGGYDLRWIFPDMRFSDNCILSISSVSPSSGYNPRQKKNTWQTPVSRAAYEQGGGHRIVHPDRDRGYFVVSAIVDLGFCELVSRPLILGRFP